MQIANDSCPRCSGDGTIHRQEINHRTQIVLTVLTAGLWSVSWLALVLSRAAWPFHCKRCGARMSAETLQAGQEHYRVDGRLATADGRN